MSSARDDDADIVGFSFSLDGAFSELVAELVEGTLAGDVYVSLLGCCCFFVTDEVEIEESEG